MGRSRPLDEQESLSAHLDAGAVAAIERQLLLGRLIELLASWKIILSAPERAEGLVVRAARTYASLDLALFLKSADPDDAVQAQLRTELIVPWQDVVSTLRTPSGTQVSSTYANTLGDCAQELEALLAPART